MYTVEIQFLFQNIKTEQMVEEIETKENMFCREIVAKVRFIFFLWKKYFLFLLNWGTVKIKNVLHFEIIPFAYSTAFGTVIFVNLLSS